MNKVDEIRNKLHEKRLSQEARRENGRLGEIIVENWLREDLKVDVLPLPQTKGDKHLLLPKGGKRPDFLVGFDGDTFFVDAKLHQTQGLKEFTLNPEEIADFRKAMEHLEIPVLFIALLPREAIDTLLLIELGEIENENQYGSRGVFKLEEANRQHIFGLISREEFDRAVEQYRKEGFNGDIPSYPSGPTQCHTANGV